MANFTSTLQLTLPGLGEFNNSWHTPVNGNFTKIDTWANGINVEIQNARFSKSTLAAFLTVGHNSDGTLKPTDEVSDARNSFVYGHKTGTADNELSDLSYQRDKEVWAARSGQTSLREGIAYPRSFGRQKILDGAKDVTGAPTWGGNVSDKVVVDGSVTPLILEIDGKIGRIRTQKEVTLSGAAGTYFIYADFNSDGESVFSAVDGETGLDSLSEPRVHRDVGTDFTTLNVQSGDMLRYNSPANIAGEYLIEDVAYNSENDKLRIVGLFPEASISSIDYSILDPLGVTLGFSATETPAAGRIFIAEAEFDGASVTAVRARHFGDTFVGEWRAVDVSSAALFEEIWNHRLGTDQIDVVIQASQANDGTQPVEVLSLATLTDTLGVTTDAGTLAVNVNNTLGYTPDNGTLGLTSGDQTLTGVVGGTLTGDVTGSLTGDPAASLTGSINTSGSVRMKSTRNQIWVKNVVSNVFYTDYDLAPRQTGYIRVIVSKKG